jgi:hypothetical protein
MLEVFFNDKARGGRLGMWGSDPTGQRVKKTVDPFPSDQPARRKSEKEPADPAEARLGILGLLQDRWLFSLARLLSLPACMASTSFFGDDLDHVWDTR